MLQELEARKEDHSYIDHAKKKAVHIYLDKNGGYSGGAERGLFGPYIRTIPYIGSYIPPR